MGMFLLCVGCVVGGEPPIGDVPHRTPEVVQFAGCTLKPEPWADGDSFSVVFPDEKARTIRLYGVDCLETSGEDETDARRLRAQRRYFGISTAGGSPKASNDKAKEFGRNAKAAVEQLLKEPFTVYTAWADARGSTKYKRYYGFVTTGAGQDLGEILVERGLARAFGVYRRGPLGTADDYRERLRDLELKAAKTGSGVWALTDWNKLPEERKAERDVKTELEAAKDKGPRPGAPIDPNTASRDELMSLPGIGETKAHAIIEARDQGRYQSAKDLTRVSGIGAKTVEALAPFLKFGAEGP